MANKNFLICLVGLPASGKSTFANQLKIALKKKYKNFNIRIIDPDKIRQKLTPNKFEHEKEYLIRKENLKLIKKELESGTIVISDDLNYYTSMRHELKEITEFLNISFFIVHISTPIDVCLKWNENRGNPIPNKIIIKINERFDEFNKYKWDVPDAVYDLSQITNLNYKINELLAIIQEKREELIQLKIVIGKKNDSNLDNERLDKITRIFVSKLLQNSTYLPFKKKIIKLRKIYMNENKNKVLSELEISETFKNHLEKNLNLKFPDFLSY